MDLSFHVHFGVHMCHPEDDHYFPDQFLVEFSGLVVIVCLYFNPVQLPLEVIPHQLTWKLQMWNHYRYYQSPVELGSSIVIFQWEKAPCWTVGSESLQRRICLAGTPSLELSPAVYYLGHVLMTELANRSPSRHL